MDGERNSAPGEGAGKAREIELRTEKMAFGGQALGRVNRFVVFVDDALPGELVRARVYKKKKDFAFARAVEVLEASPDRVAPGCAWSGNCGGCSFRHCAYAAQLRLKREVLQEALHGVRGAAEAVADVVASPETDDYRNKMVYTFGTGPDGELRLGLHRRGSFMNILPANDCLLQSEASREIVRRTLGMAARLGIGAFHEIKKTPGLRTLMVREARATGQRMVELLATADYPGLPEAFSAAMEGLAETVYVSRDDNIQGSPTSSERRLVRGPGVLVEELNGLKFRIGPDTFFQSNTAQAAALFRAVREEAAADGWSPATALDLFTGTGPIALHLASVAERVYGVENWAPSVASARKNAECNGIRNAEFLVADVNKALPPGLPPRADLVVVDPPRPGLSLAAVDWILRMDPRRIVYVSCNPSTLARDLEWFAQKAPQYRVASVRPFDLFPHTFHVETVARLDRA
ncbi:MAG: 23S rRNA (uracil(1939)-C(5))-methyltransferase RlmD [Kiritimatiellae bacterium]|nr:23S rRNA (uracil(1939)-C(5))-methyltransferase RlmD [Kiritimatiellia bacterium]